MTWRQLQVSRGQLQHNLEASRQELHLSREAQITERFTKAIDQLDYAKSLDPPAPQYQSSTQAETGAPAVPERGGPSKSLGIDLKIDPVMPAC